MSIESASSQNNFDYEEYENLSDVASTATQPDEEEAAVAASAATRPISQEDSSVPVADGTETKQLLTAPKDAAAKCIESLVKTLRWPGQATAYRDIGSKFVRLYSKHYHEDQKIVTAKAEGAYEHTSCNVTAQFLQPTERAREVSAKYNDLVARVTAHCEKVSRERGAFFVEMLEINNEERKNELIIHAAKSIHHMAELLLTAIDGKAYNPHNLVADMLLLHHGDVLRRLCHIEDFVRVYKQTHKCGREPEPFMDLFERRFPSTTAADGNQDTASSTNRTASPTTQNTAVQAANQVPPTTGAKSNNSSDTRRNLWPQEHTKAKTSQDDDEDYALARVLALSKDDANIQSLLAANPKLQKLQALGDQLNSKEGGLISVIASKITRADAEQKSPSSKKKALPSLGSPELIWNPYKKEVMFTRKGHDNYWNKAYDDSMRKLNCKHDCLIESIRPENFALFKDWQQIAQQPAPPGTNPPTFNASTEDAEAQTAREKLFNQVPLMKLGAAAGRLGNHANQLFNVTIMAYMKQIERNRAHKAVNQEASKFRKESAGVETAQKIATAKPPPPEPILNDLIVEGVQKGIKIHSRKFENELNSTKRELENVKRNLQAEKSKRRKLELQMSKEKRGPPKGASQTNTGPVIDLASPDRQQHSPPPTFPPSTLNTAVTNQHTPSPSHERQRGGPRSDGPQGRAPGRGRGNGRGRGRGGRGHPPHPHNPNRRVHISDEVDVQTREPDDQHWPPKGGKWKKPFHKRGNYFSHKKYRRNDA